MAASAGVDEPTRQLIAERRLDDPSLSAYDSALLHFTAQAVARPRVDDTVFAQARTHLSDRELVEVLQIVGYYWSFGRISTTLDVEITKIYGDEPVLDTPTAS
jgi:alkylhydroperoxidase family enzyme